MATKTVTATSVAFVRTTDARRGATVNVVCTAPRSNSEVATMVPSSTTSSNGIQLIPVTADRASSATSSWVPPAVSAVSALSTAVATGRASTSARSHWMERRPRALMTSLRSSPEKSSRAVVVVVVVVIARCPPSCTRPRPW